MEGYQIFLAVPDGSPYSFTRFGARVAHFGADRIYIDKDVIIRRACDRMILRASTAAHWRTSFKVCVSPKLHPDFVVLFYELYRSRHRLLSACEHCCPLARTF